MLDGAFWDGARFGMPGRGGGEVVCTYPPHPRGAPDPSGAVEARPNTDHMMAMSYRQVAARASHSLRLPLSHCARPTDLTLAARPSTAAVRHATPNSSYMETTSVYASTHMSSHACATCAAHASTA